MIPGQAMERRRFLARAAQAGLSVCLLGVALIGSSRKRAGAAVELRPPGALPEPDFLAACVRCGLCVRACPYDTLSLPDTGPAPGTPSFIARRIPCEMCEDIPCVAACPTGALNPALKDITKARMGVAVLSDHENCLNWQGLRCDVCYRVCPAIDKAITLDEVHNQRTGKHARFLPNVHAEHCTGCGKCENSCVLEEAAIKVLPQEIARGAMGAHYRLGWEEKKLNQGKPLIGDTIQLPVRAPGEGGGLP